MLSVLTVYFLVGLLFAGFVHRHVVCYDNVLVSILIALIWPVVLFLLLMVGLIMHTTNQDLVNKIFGPGKRG